MVVMVFVVNSAGIGFGKDRMDVTICIGMGFGQEAVAGCWMLDTCEGGCWETFHTSV